MAVDTKAPGQAPPDLPSLLLDGRICYIGMPVGGVLCRDRLFPSAGECRLLPLLRAKLGLEQELPPALG
jgi:hypothetical protein